MPPSKTRAIGAFPGHRPNLAATLTRCIELTGMRFGAAYSMTDEHDPTLVSWNGFGDAEPLKGLFGEQAMLMEALKRAEGKITALGADDSDPQRVRALLERAGLSLMLLVPIIADERLRGLIVLGTPHLVRRWDLHLPDHTQRVRRYCRLLATWSGLSARACQMIGEAGALHDVGKLTTPAEILLKPAALTAGERRTVELHAEHGYRILAGAVHRLGRLGAEIAWTHHEHWDGGGYPRGLKGGQIPLTGRIAAIADVFDALTSDRPYRPAMKVHDVLELMQAGAGTHFDPRLLSLFLEWLPSRLDGAADDPLAGRKATNA